MLSDATFAVVMEELAERKQMLVGDLDWFRRHISGPNPEHVIIRKESAIATIDAAITELQSAQAAGEWIDVEYNDVINVDNSNQIRVVIDQGKRDKRIHLHVRKRVNGEWSHVGVTTLSDGYRLQKRIGSQERRDGK